MVRRTKREFPFARLEPRQLLAAEFLGGNSLQWVDAGGNPIDNAELPNRTLIFAELTSSDNLPDTLDAEVFEDDTFFDDFMSDIQLQRVDSTTWRGPWRTLWSDDGIGVPEYYFRSEGQRSSVVSVIQGNGWHAQKSVSGQLGSGDSLSVGFQPEEIPTGLKLANLGVELDFGVSEFPNGRPDLQIEVGGPHVGWMASLDVSSEQTLSEPVTAIFRTAGCESACPGNDFSGEFLKAGISNGFHGDWSIGFPLLYLRLDLVDW